MAGFGLASLHGIVSAAVGTVNPFVTATVERSAGFTQGSVSGGAAGRTPIYTTSTIQCQVQAMSGRDLRQLDGLNLQNVTRKLYVAGSIEGVIRAAQKGGDKIIFPNGTLPEGNVWLATIIFEMWPTWCSLGLTLQIQ